MIEKSEIMDEKEDSIEKENDILKLNNHSFDENNKSFIKLSDESNSIECLKEIVSENLSFSEMNIEIPKKNNLNNNTSNPYQKQSII